VEILIADYDPQWPDLYNREAGRIRAVLGERILRLEHAGSTAVPGLAAKPLIDIVLEVADSADEDAWLRDLEAHGYRLRIREPEWNEHRMLKGPATNINLHVYSRGCPEIEKTLKFRDRLRNDPADRALYEQEKRRLAERHWDNVQDYADAKTAIVEDILSRAD
jgi:GrpB-like predicted nucleotidyltransferase (UPF0157 family)